MLDRAQSLRDHIAKLDGMLRAAIHLGELRADEMIVLAMELQQLRRLIHKAVGYLKEGRADKAYQLLRRYERDYTS